MGREREAWEERERLGLLTSSLAAAAEVCDRVLASLESKARRAQQ